MRLLCATDLLPKSEFAIERAGVLADELDAELSLLHVVSPLDCEGALEKSLQVAISRMKSRVRPPSWRAGTVASVVVRAGNPARVIVDTLAREKPDLLILGPRGKRGVRHALEGTIAEKTVSARRCPVLMVQGAPSAAYRNVLLALHVAAGARIAVRAAERLVLQEGAQAMVIHSCASRRRASLPSPDIQGPGAGLHGDGPNNPVATRAMRELLERESADCERYELVASEGNPLAAIRRALELHRPDLLVLETGGEGRMRALFGSVVNQLLKVAPCDLLIVPHGAARASAAAHRERPTLSGAPMSP